MNLPWDLAREFLKSPSLGLRDQQGSEDTAQHEESEDLHDVVQPWAGSSASRARLSTTSSERTEHTLSDDSTDLASTSGDTVAGGSVTGRETFTGNDECGRVGTKVEEELSQDVEGKDRVVAERVESEADDQEENSADGETHDLDRLAAKRIDRGNGGPVTGNGASAGNDQVTDGGAVEDLVHVATT